MPTIHLIFKCPNCSSVAPATTLKIAGPTVEITCGACSVINEFSTYDGEVRAESALGKAASGWAWEDNSPTESGAPHGSDDVPEASLDLPGLGRGDDNDVKTRPDQRVPGDREEANAQFPKRPTTGLGDEFATGPHYDDLVQVADGVAGVSSELLGHYRETVKAGDGLDAHKELLRFAVAAGQLEQLGLIYRHRLQRFPDDDRAKSMREHVVAAAVAAMGPHTDMSTRTARNRSIGYVLAGLFVLTACAAFVWVLGRSGCLPQM